jgi:uncharacterized RDD family membrane protein YckC
VSPGVLPPAAAGPESNGAPAGAPVPLPAQGSPYSGLATRVIAGALDVLLVQAVAWIVAAVAAVAASLFEPSGRVEAVLIAIGGVVAVLWAVSYFVFFWTTTGQTPGDRVMGIRVQDATTGRPLRLGRAALRLAGAVVSLLLLFAGYLLILVDARRRAFHDRLAGTVVVYAAADPPTLLEPATGAPEPASARSRYRPPLVRVS